MTATVTPPYQAKIPRTDTPEGGYRTAEQELADAFEGQAPHLAKELAELLGPARTAKLAQVIHRAVAVGIKRYVDQDVTARLQGLWEVLEEGLHQVDPDCVSPEGTTDA